MNRYKVIGIMIVMFLANCFGADGTFIQTGGKWGSAENWLDGVIANNGGIAWLPFGTGMITLDIPVTLQRLEVAQPRQISSEGSGQLYMAQNPVIKADTHPRRADSLTITTMVFGDGSEILLTGGGTFNMDAGAAFTNFSCVTVRDTTTISLRQSVPFSWSDLRLEQTRLNNNSQQYTLFTPCRGTMYVGAGANVVRIGYWGPMALPGSMVREAYGTLQIVPGTNRVHMVDALSYMDSYGRLPTWLLSMSNSDSVYNFATYDNVLGIIPFANACTNINEVTSTLETVSHTTGGVLERDVQLDALNVGLTNLSLNGKTLTLGNSGTLGTLILSKDIKDATGTLTFTGEEGLIIGNGEPVRIEPKITGSATLTLMGGVDNINSKANRTIHLSNVNNNFNGGMHILLGRVAVEGSDTSVLGTGDIWVHGLSGTFTESGSDNHNAFGGQLWLSGGVLTNRLYLAGQGSEGFSALRLGGNVVIESAITVSNSAAIRVESNSVVSITGNIDGNSMLRLFVEDDARVEIARPMSYSGGTYIGAPLMIGQGNDPGNVILTGEATLGTGPVINHGNLVLDRAEDWTVNSLTGTGFVHKVNARRLALTAPLQISGAVLDAGATILPTGTNTIGSLYGKDGSIVAGVADHAVVVLGNDEARDAEFSGVISNGMGEVTLVKRGANTQVLAGCNQYSGATVVQAGILKLKEYPLDDLPLVRAPATLHLDASLRAKTVVTNALGFVSSWRADNDPNIIFSQANPAMQPLYDVTAMNGLGAVRFAGGLFDGVAVTNRLSCSASNNIREQTVYAVNQPLAYRMFDGLIGETDKDQGIRLSGLNNWDGSFPRWGYKGNNNYAINGEEAKTTFASGKPHLVRTRVANAWDIGKKLSVGQFFDNTANFPRSFNGYICEIVMFKHLLSEAEDKAVSAYLMNKWGISDAVNQVRRENILPTSSPVTVEFDGVLDVNGARQSFASLNCYGTLSNSSEKPADLEIHAGEINAVMQGTINITKSGAATLKMALREATAGGGTLTVNAGTLQVDAWKSQELPVTSGRTFWLDASVDQSVVTNVAGEVTTWINQGAAGGNFTKDANNRSTLPVYSATAFNGRGGVWFQGTAETVTNRLTSTATSTLRTVFFLTQTDQYSANAGIFGPRDGDNGLRLANSTTWQNYRDGAAEQGFGYASNFFVNGVNTRSFKQAVPYVLMVRANQPNWSQSWSIGNYFHWSSGVQTRAYNGLIGEIIAYDRVLTDAEQSQVEEYLTKKWIVYNNMKEDLLPVAARLTVAQAATLDLGQTTQTVQSLTGSGLVANGTLIITEALYLTVDEHGNVQAPSLDKVVLVDGVELLFDNPPMNGSKVLASNHLTVNAATLKLLPGWVAKAKNDSLYVYRTGSIIMIR